MSRAVNNTIGVLSKVRTNLNNPLLCSVIGRVAGGKTTLLLKMVAEYSKKGQNCLYLSTETPERSIVNRLNNVFAYYKSRPTGNVLVKNIPPGMPYNIENVKNTIRRKNIKLLVIDSVEVLNYHFNDFFFSTKNHPRALLLEKKIEVKENNIMDLPLYLRAKKTMEILRHLSIESNCHIVVSSSINRSLTDGRLTANAASYFLLCDLSLSCNRGESMVDYENKQITVRVEKNRSGMDGHLFKIPII